MTGGYEPGRPAVGTEPVGAEPVVALCSNENPLGASPHALRALLSAAVHVYPDPQSDVLRQRLSVEHDVEVARIAVGPGTTDLIYHLVRAAGGGVLAPTHTFVAYRLAARIAGVDYREVPLDRLAREVGPDTRLICIANPGNPTGELHSREQLLALLADLRPTVTVVLDEAYHEYLDPAVAPDGIVLARTHPAVVVLRTFSKAYGLAGLRVGYAVGAPDRIHQLDVVRPPFSVSGPAQAAAVAALDDPDHVRASRLVVERGRLQLQQGLAALGVQAPGGAGNFVLLNVGPRARAVWEVLLRSGVLVRRLEAYGLPEHLRVTIGTDDQNRRLLGVLALALSG